MLKNIERRKFLMELRHIHLQVIKRCLEEYKNTQDKYYYDFAKWLGGVSKELKDDIDKLK